LCPDALLMPGWARRVEIRSSEPAVITTQALYVMAWIILVVAGDLNARPAMMSRMSRVHTRVGNLDDPQARLALATSGV
jgi:hypothetical protein